MPGSEHQEPTDAGRIERLGRDWDALVQDQNTPLDPEFAPTLWELHMLDSTDGPSDAFSQRLWSDLERALPPTRLRPRWHTRPFVLAAAALALLLIGVALLAALRGDDAAPPDNHALVPASTPSPSPSPTTQVPVVVPTEARQETPPLAVVSPTPAGVIGNATNTPTPPVAAVDPDATVPTGVGTPQPQLGGPPEYFALENYVNNAVAIVSGSITGPVATNEYGLPIYELIVGEIVRGDVPAEALQIHGVSSDVLTHEQYLVFLLGPFATAGGDFYTIDQLVPLADDLVVPLDYQTTEYHIRATYGGEPVASLITDIQAIPRVEDEIGELLGQFGWTPIRKGYLWPQTLPETSAFSGSGPFPRRAPTWARALDASQRIGLDFRPYAGQRVQWLPYVVERDMVNGERLLMAEFVVVDQRVVGAWVVVLPGTGTEWVYGLDEREAVVALPVAIPTPAPTPTPAIPSSDTVNPSQFYDLASTETLTLCWPHCDPEPKTVVFRDALVAALDRELEIEPVSAHPTPTQPVEIVHADGSFVWITFGHLDPNGPYATFGYDRAAGLVLLPHGAGWIPAPVELAEAFSEVEPPAPPSKER
jgi:hypothetical protein